MSNPKSKYWQAVAQDKKGPSTRSRTRREEVSNGANLSSSESGATAMTEARQGQPPGLDEEGPGSQPPPCAATIKSNRRGLKTQSWSVAHKKVLLYCYHYSRYEKWSRTSNEILIEKIRDSDLPEDKKNIPVANLRSLVSQMGRHITPDENTIIKNEALRDAERDYLPIQEEETRRRQESKWDRDEKWTIVWAMEYAKAKHTRQKQITETWREIFFHFHPGKRNVPPKKITGQRSNSIQSGFFSEAELDYMRSQVAALVTNKKSPLEFPVILPTSHQPPTTPAEPQPHHHAPAQPSEQPRPMNVHPGSPSPPRSSLGSYSKKKK